MFIFQNMQLKTIFIFLLKIILVSAFVGTYNLITNGLVNDYDFNILSNFAQYILFIKLYVFLFKPKTKFDQIFDVSLLIGSILFTVVTAYLIGRNKFFPEFFPCMPIFCFLAILLAYFKNKNQYIIICFLLLLSFLCGKFWVSSYYFEKYKTNSLLAKSDSSIQDIQFYNLDSQLVTLNPTKYKVSILKFSFRNCLPCRQLNPMFDEWCKEYKTNPNILIAKINPVEDIAFINAVTDSQDLKITYSDLYTGNSKSNRFNVQLHPVTIIMDAKGKQVYRFDGYWRSTKEKQARDFKHTVDSLLSVP